MDLFIIIMSSALALRFRQIKERMVSERDQILTVTKKATDPDFLYPTYSSIFFREIRRDYNLLSDLCRHLNKVLSNLIVLSYTTNLSFILVQLFNSLRYNGS